VVLRNWDDWDEKKREMVEVEKVYVHETKEFGKRRGVRKI
jgi:hypothetical protein